MMEYFKKSYKILDNNEKLTFFFISLLNILVIFLELLGISIIFPIVSNILLIISAHSPHSNWAIHLLNLY